MPRSVEVGVVPAGIKLQRQLSEPTLDERPVDARVGGSRRRNMPRKSDPVGIAEKPNSALRADPPRRKKAASVSLRAVDERLEGSQLRSISCGLVGCVTSQGVHGTLPDGDHHGVRRVGHASDVMGHANGGLKCLAASGDMRTRNNSVNSRTGESRRLLSAGSGLSVAFDEEVSVLLRSFPSVPTSVGGGSGHFSTSTYFSDHDDDDDATHEGRNRRGGATTASSMSVKTVAGGEDSHSLLRRRIPIKPRQATAKTEVHSNSKMSRSSDSPAMHQASHRRPKEESVVLRMKHEEMSASTTTVPEKNSRRSSVTSASSESQMSSESCSSSASSFAVSNASLSSSQQPQRHQQSVMKHQISGLSKTGNLVCWTLEDIKFRADSLSESMEAMIRANDTQNIIIAFATVATVCADVQSERMRHQLGCYVFRMPTFSLNRLASILENALEQASSFRREMAMVRQAGDAVTRGSSISNAADLLKGEKNSLASREIVRFRYLVEAVRCITMQVLCGRCSVDMKMHVNEHVRLMRAVAHVACEPLLPRRCLYCDQQFNFRVPPWVAEQRVVELPNGLRPWDKLLETLDCFGLGVLPRIMLEDSELRRVLTNRLLEMGRAWEELGVPVTAAEFFRLRCDTRVLSMLLAVSDEFRRFVVANDELVVCLLQLFCSLILSPNELWEGLRTHGNMEKTRSANSSIGKVVNSRSKIVDDMWRRTLFLYPPSVAGEVEAAVCNALMAMFQLCKGDGARAVHRHADRTIRAVRRMAELAPLEFLENPRLMDAAGAVLHIARLGSAATTPVVNTHYCSFDRAKHYTLLLECAFCGVVKVGSTHFKLCSGCRLARYCDRDCQLKDWKQGHAQLCRSLGEALEVSKTAERR